jgi:hypothetical protein
MRAYGCEAGSVLVLGHLGDAAFSSTCACFLE